MSQLTRIALACSILAAVPLVQAAPIALTNAGFEAAWTGQSNTGTAGDLTFTYQPTGPDLGWAFGASTGLANGYSLLAAYEGSRFAFLQGATGKISQTFSLADAMAVSLNFELALRPNYAAGQVVRVSIDGNTVADVLADSTTWKLHDLNLGLLSSGNHEIAFQGLSAISQFGDTSAYVDAVRLDGQSARELPEPASLPTALLAAALALGIWRRRALKV